MTAFSVEEQREHFAFCVHLFGGTTAFSRKLEIDERAVRRFMNGERTVSESLLSDTAKALRVLINDATAAEKQLMAMVTPEPNTPA